MCNANWWVKAACPCVGFAVINDGVANMGCSHGVDSFHPFSANWS